MIDERDRQLVFITAAAAIILFLLTFVGREADARVALNEPTAYSVGSDGCSMFVDGCSFANQMTGVADKDAAVERSYYLSIKDGVAMGIDAFGLDMTANTTYSTYLLARLSAAMKKYNGENAGAKKCIFVSYRAAGGEALAMFNAADSNNSSDSPYCSVEGKPLVGVKQVAAAVDPLPGLAGKGPFVVLGTASNAADGVPTATVVSTWKTSGASRVISYPDASIDMNMSATAKATATAAGASFAYGIPSSWARQCGGPECKGPAASGYTFRDGKGFLAATAALQASLRDPSASVVFPYAFPGKYDEDVSWESAKICDSNDTVAKSGYACPNVPAHLRGTIPTGNAGLSFSNKSQAKAGFNRIGQWWADKYKSRADPAATPFVAWAHREHPIALAGIPALTVQKSWTASSSTADYTFLAPSSSAFAAGQIPWGAYDMAAGDVFRAEASTGSNGYLRQRVVTGPLQFGDGLPKGAPNVTFGDHFDYRPTIRPLGDGVWSNTISELKVSVGGTATAESTGGYARALQIHGFRTAYTGSAWSEVSSTDGDTYDIQIRYKTSGDFPRFAPGAVPSDVFRERRKIGDHTWDIYRTNGGWTSDLGMSFDLVGGDLDAISNVDIKAILDYTLVDANARYSRSDTGIYVRGVQAWIEPRVGTVDATVEGMSVRYNGSNYGVPYVGICPTATASMDVAGSLDVVQPTLPPTPPEPPVTGTYDLALEFDNRAAGTTYTNAMQVEDSGGRAVENYTGGIYTSPITIVDNGEGGKALRVGVGPNCQQASHRPTGLTPGKEYIFETRLRFAPNFVSAQKDGGGKVFFGIQGGVNNTYNPSANDTSGSTLVMYAGKSRLRDYTYDQTRSCVGSPSCWGKVYHDFGSKSTGWHTIKIRTKLNTPGQSNGILEYWYDGVKTLSKTNMLWIKAGIDWSWYKARFTTTIGGPCTVGGTNSFSEASYIDYDYFRYRRVN